MATSDPPMTEFYLTTLWTYTPKAVDEVIRDIEAKGFDRAEFLYDREYSWFKVSCREDQVDEIRWQFCHLAREFEEDAFDDSEEDLLSLDGSLKPSFENEWFTQDDPSSDVGKVDEQYCRPKALDKYPCVELWDDLDEGNEPYSYWEIIHTTQAMALASELGIELSPTLAGRLVFIGGHKKQSIGEAMERLRVMLSARKLLSPPPRADHVVYAEDSRSPVTPGLTADIRYLANIDPRLACSTLIDRLLVANLADSYEILYRESSSIRICPWSPDKGCYVSLLGPKVAARPRDKTALGNRPAIFTRMIDKYTPTKEPNFLEQKHIGSEANRQVGTWVENVPVPEESVRRAAHYVLDTGSQAAASSSGVPEQKDLMDFNDDETTLCPGTPALTGANTQKSASRQPPSALRAQLGMSRAKEIMGSQNEELGFTGDGSLIDMLAAVDTRSAEDMPRSTINWGMAPLIPLPVDDPADRAGNPTLNLASNLPMSRGAPQPGTSAEDEVLMEKHTATGQVSGGNTSQSHGLTNPSNPSAQLSLRPAPRPGTGASGALPVTGGFVNEIHAALAKLLVTGPYRRGKVEVRAEFGRIILEKVDKSGLAFNSESTPSEGWEKATLLQRLKSDFGGNRNIHFTKILSAYGPNIEDMINTEVEGAPIWEHKPSCASTTYSCYCALRLAKHIPPFIVDIEDDGTLSAELSYSIRLNDNEQVWDKPKPIYVHAICRHWDLRMVMHHVKTDEVEAVYGSLARDLMQSLSILRNENGALELQFAVPTTSCMDVREVRVLTKWRIASIDRNSALEITEVQQMKTEPYSGGPYSKASWNSYEGKQSRPWSNRMIKDSKGEVARWYEAAVVSAELEDMCRQNALLKVGMKADWDVEDLEGRGVFSAIYAPALHMVRAMDHVGRLDDNNLSQINGHLLLQHNDPPPQVVGSGVAKMGKRKGR
ncbi:hypothetical protein F5144DRAFT_638559 [Chaetomium tenue]|uniref:Uncharacterized protein n=1 Tax=Chaetomium tenue TaxID=1854479 RepID=A0ACB7PP93_9PEZI|nr:hypothetical protein F5144DRAFT_638559 [Chaetomium globosum]